VEDVLRSECIKLGLIQPTTRVSPVDVEAKIEASAKDLSAELRNVLKEHFGDQVEIDGETIKWKGGVEAHEQTSQNRRQSAGRICSGSAGPLESIQPADDASEGVRSAVREAARVNAVEISAVASGRKPLFHEDLG